MDIIQKALLAKRESKNIEFKETFDLNSSQDWCEIIKDIIAISNSGGGIILFGIDNKGLPTGKSIISILSLDLALITDKIQKYTGIQFDGINILEKTKGRKKIALMKIERTSIPIIFTKPGTYDIGKGKQRNVFGKGSLYFRHGAKSEPGTNDDIRKAIERQLENIRKSWIKGVRKVVQVPEGYKVITVPSEVVESTSDQAQPIRIVDDPNAPVYRKLNFDLIYPYRQKELLGKVNSKLTTTNKINQYDIQSIHTVHKTDKNEKFCFKPFYAQKQYSDAFVNWIIDKSNSDKQFFKKTRKKCYEIKHSL